MALAAQRREETLVRIWRGFARLITKRQTWIALDIGRSVRSLERRRDVHAGAFPERTPPRVDAARANQGAILGSQVCRELKRAVASSQKTLDGLLFKARFWQRWAGTPMNRRQVKLLNRLLDGFEGKLTSSKWTAIAKCSADTALREITELMALGVLRKTPGGGRSTAYELAD